MPLTILELTHAVLRLQLLLEAAAKLGDVPKSRKKPRKQLLIGYIIVVPFFNSAEFLESSGRIDAGAKTEFASYNECITDC